MEIITTVAEMKARVAEWKAQGAPRGKYWVYDTARCMKATCR